MRNKKMISSLIFTVAIGGGFSTHDVPASTVVPSEAFVSSLLDVLMVDGKDRDSLVTIRARLDLPKRSAFDFGFILNDSFVSITGQSRHNGNYTFAGDSLVDFALRNQGSDGLFGTADDAIFRLTDSAGYVSQHYYAAVTPSRSRLPVVTEPYYRKLSLDWDLNLDGRVDAHVLLNIKGGKFDGMMPGSIAVSLPGASWLLGSGLVALGITARRRKRPA